jgi:peroxiredoxin Q/BCP
MSIDANDKSMVSMLLSNAALFGGSSETLAVGDAAPEFSLHGSDGATVRLADYKGKRAVVLAWFPRAFTPG